MQIGRFTPEAGHETCVHSFFTFDNGYGASVVQITQAMIDQQQLVYALFGIQPMIEPDEVGTYELAVGTADGNPLEPDTSDPLGGPEYAHLYTRLGLPEIEELLTKLEAAEALEAA